MSIVFSLKRLFDPIEARKEEGELKKKREETQSDRDGGGPDPRRFRCRVCAWEDDHGNYCAKCLADTMVPIARAAGEPK